MNPLYTAVATSEGGRNGKVKSSDGVLKLNLRPPVEMGGTGGDYTNPEQLFAAGYAACFGGALSHVAIAKGLRIRPTVTAKVTISSIEGCGFELSVELDILVPGVDQATADELAEAAHQFCPYSKATRNNIEVKINAKAV